MADDYSQIKFSDEIEVKIREIAQESGSCRDEVVQALMQVFFEMVDDLDKKDVPCLVEEVRKALREKSNQASR